MAKTRKWLITIENPSEHGETHDLIIDKLSKLKLDYFCLCDEIGLKTQTYHTHIFIYRGNAVRFETLKNIFPSAHLDMVRGSCQENYDYIRKQGKYKNTDKEDTNLPETFQEFGELPIERQGARTDIEDMLDMVKSGASNYEIVQELPSFYSRLEQIDNVRNLFLSEKYKYENRNVHVTYLYGATGSGKTSYVFEKYGFKDVYRVTDYSHPFDSYQSQRVLLFEEFRSSLPLRDMLSYLDRYPLELPSRYHNKVACYEEVYIATNIPLSKQYLNIQHDEPESFRAFERRIDEIKEIGHPDDFVTVSDIIIPFLNL